MSSQLPPPVPTDALYDVASRVITITFDQPLTPPLLDDSNWLLHRASVAYPPTAQPVVLGNTVTFEASIAGVAGPQGKFVEYSAAIPDLTGPTGVPVAPFLYDYTDLI